MSTRLATRRRATLDQPALWGDPEPVEAPPPPSKAKRRRNHTLGLPKPWTATLCAAACITCRRPEEFGLCSGGCAIACGQPDKTGPVEVCLITRLATARLVAEQQWATVRCPHCDRMHWHNPTPGRRYRVGQCGQPYIVHLAEGPIQ